MLTFIDPASKQMSCIIFLDGIRMPAIGRAPGIYHKTVYRWLMRLAHALPVSRLQIPACSFIEVDEFCSLIGSKIQILSIYYGCLIRGKVLYFVFGRSMLHRLGFPRNRFRTCRQCLITPTCWRPTIISFPASSTTRERPSSQNLIIELLTELLPGPAPSQNAFL